MSVETVQCIVIMEVNIGTAVLSHRCLDLRCRQERIMERR